MSHETVRRRVAKFGAPYAAEVRKREVRAGHTWHLDARARRVGGRVHRSRHAVDEHGQTLDLLLQVRSARRCNTRVEQGPPTHSATRLDPSRVVNVTTALTIRVTEPA